MQTLRRRFVRKTCLWPLALVFTLLVAAVDPAAFSGVMTARAAPTMGTIANSADGVHMRAEPTFGATVLQTLPQGAQVGLRTHLADTVHDPDGVTRWWPVSVDGVDGWVAGYYLDLAWADGAPEMEAALPRIAEAAGGLAWGDEHQADVGTAEEFQLMTWNLEGAAALIAELDGVNLRSEPGTQSPLVRALPFQTRVELRVDELDTVYVEGSRWWPVASDGATGWVSGRYLEPAEVWSGAQGGTDDVPANDVVPTSKLESFLAGSYVAATTGSNSGLNIRADAAPDAERVGVVPESDVVQVMDGPHYDPIGNPWYLITTGDVSGFVSGHYLQHADQPGEAAPAVEIPSKVATPGMATGALMYPVESWTFTQAYGCSPFPWFYAYNEAWGCHFHNGIDLAAPAYTPILAADGGVVEYSGWCDCGLGYYVKIDHGNGMKTLYGHMAELPWVSSGQVVAKGEIIGPMGSTGISTGPHIHFIVNIDGVDVDPLAYIS